MLTVARVPIERNNSSKPYHIHMIGICGAGMCGIAEVLLGFGYQVSGSDIKANSKIGKHLQAIGAVITAKHSADNIKDIDIVVYSSAIDATNIELQKAKELGIACMGRAEMLADLIRYFYGIAVAGTHGKTTTTSLVQSIFTAAKLEPTYIIGGRLLSKDSNASVGKGKHFIIEADESDASFKHIHPVIAIITNMDKDHMATYQNDFNLLKQAYVDFIHNIPFYGIVILCADDENIKSVMNKIHRKIITYSLDDSSCDYYASDIKQSNHKTDFILHTKTEQVPISLNLCGKHNVRNALAALAVAHYSGIKSTDLQIGMSSFAGVSRRFNNYTCQINNNNSNININVIDDYGHHPVEIAATLSTAKEIYPNNRIILIFQPHRYSRTQALFDDFIAILEQADVLIVEETYAASESAISGYTSQDLCSSIRLRKKIDPIFAATNQDAVERLTYIAQDGDVVIIQGAGNIDELVDLLPIKKLC